MRTVAAVGGGLLRRGLAGGLIALIALGLAACTSGSGYEPAGSAPTETPSATSSSPMSPCRTPALDAERSFAAAATGGEVNALVFGSLPPPAGSELKIVWRVTGEGDLAVRAVRPDGSAASLSFGPEFHPTSTFSRPGEEWGTGILFDVPGCWQLEVRRGTVRARIPVQVSAATPPER